MAGLLDRFSFEDLEKMCTLAFWFGLGSDRAMRWGDSRREMELFLSGVSAETLARFERFLDDEPTIAVAADHARRVAALPIVVREKAALIEPAAFARQPKQQALEELLSPDDSELLLRWANWLAAPPRSLPSS
jgi:hypothetical protein